jgi:5-formyltetrahydrofolate cyclo-ligase
MNKEELRNKIRDLKIENFGNNDQDYILWSSNICDLLSTFIHYQNATEIAIYASKSATYEPETDKIINYSIEIGKKVYIPRCITSTRNLELLKIQDLEKDTELATFNLREPKKSLPLPNQLELQKQLTIVFVPGMAFDVFGNRLGYGSGYFDNFLRDLKKNNRKIIVIALAFEFQVFTEEIPHTDLDSRVDYIITSKSILKTYDKKKK